MCWCGYLYFTTGGEKIYHKEVRKPSKIKGFGNLTIAYHISNVGDLNGEVR